MPPKQYDNHYARLGIPFDAAPREIRRAYHEAAKRLHPDANPTPEATDQFLLIQAAFDALSDPGARAEYDRSLGPVDSQDALVLTSLASRESLPRTTESQLFYVMLKLEPQGRDSSGSSQPPINVCLVIDTSTSMKGQRMDMVKITARRILRQLRPADVFSVVAFNDRAEVIVPAARDRDANKTEARISQIQPGGGTEIFQGLQAGFEQLQRYQRSASVNHLVLVTDGHTYGDEDKCLALADRIKQNGITISALGLGQQWNEKFLDRLASKTGGSSTYVAHARDIKQFLERKFDGLQNVFAENIRLEIEPAGSQVALRYLFRVQPEPTRLEPQATTALGNLSVGESMVLLLEFMIENLADGEQSLKVLEGDVRYEIAGRMIPAGRTRGSVELPIAADHVPGSPPQEIIQAMSRLTLYRMQEQVRTELEAGEYEAATRRLRHMATHMLAAGEHELGSTILNEAARLENGVRRTRTLKKSIMYGTRSLIPGSAAQTVRTGKDS